MRHVHEGESRPGFSLVEIVVVVALTSILLGAVGSMVYSLNRWDRGSRERYIGRDQSVRLAEVLRKDIRRAENVVLSEQGVLEVVLPAAAVARYELTPEGCRRAYTFAGEEKPRLDLFAVGKSGAIRLDRQEVGGRPMIVVTLPLVDASERPVSRAPLMINAILGGDVPAKDSNSATK